MKENATLQNSIQYNSIQFNNLCNYLNYEKLVHKKMRCEIHNYFWKLNCLWKEKEGDERVLFWGMNNAKVTTFEEKLV
jgi:hypothetical protein